MPGQSGRYRMSPSMQGFVALVAVLSFTGIVYQELLWAGLIDQGDRSAVALADQWSSYYERLGPVLKENPGDNWTHIFDIFTSVGVQRPPNTGGYWQPLVMISLAIDAHLASTQHALGFHFHGMNLAIHLLNCSLVFVLLRQFSKTLVWPVLLTLLFALHPVQVETVAWVSQRMTLLAAMFALLSTNCYVRYAKTGNARWTLPMLVFYACILMSRPLYLVLPGVFLLLDVWPLKRQGWRTLVEKMPLFGLMLLGNIIDGRIRDGAQLAATGGMEGAESLLHNFSSLLVRYAWPFDLSPFHAPETTVGTMSLGLGFDILVLIGFAAALVMTFKKCRPAFVGLVGAAIIPIQAILEAPYSEWRLSDQYLYLALVIPAVCAVASLGDVTWPNQSKRRQWAVVAMASIVAACSVGAYSQTLVWHSDRDMARQSIALYPDRAFGYIAMVEAYIAENEIEGALHYAEIAQSIEPDNPSTHFYLGTVLLLYESGRSAQAIVHLEAALKSNPNWIECLQNLGVALGRNGQTEEAVKRLELARDLNPASAGIRMGLGTAYLQINKYADARREFEEALRRNNTPSAHLGLAIAWAANDMPDYAQRHLEAAVNKDPNVRFRAGRSPMLQKYSRRPGFESLISVDPEANAGDGPVIDSPTSFESGGAS